MLLANLSQALFASVIIHLQSGQQTSNENIVLMKMDTHVKGVTVSDSSIRAKPDLLLCDTYTEAANVVSVVQAKSTLAEANNYVDIAF